jgi:hypothetical protein
MPTPLCIGRLPYFSPGGILAQTFRISSGWQGNVRPYKS